jgi:hypothetical protein
LKQYNQFFNKFIEHELIGPADKYSTGVHLIQSLIAHIIAPFSKAIIISFSADIEMGFHNLDFSVGENVNAFVSLFNVGSSNLERLVR